jgi:16S rRNA (cytosine967-C5)-methyltransferase
MPKAVKQGFPRPRSRTLSPGSDGWETAVLLAERWLAAQPRVDVLLEQLTPGLGGQERARAQHLFFGVVRWASRIESALAGLMARAPRTRVKAVLFVAGFELLEEGAEPAQVVHHAVEKAKTIASAKEAGLINAVARKLATRLAVRPAAPAEALAHPDWLVERWVKHFGPEPTAQLLAWNQTAAPVYARWRKGGDVPSEALAPTKWPGYFEVKAGQWETVRRLAQDGALYLQDPSTRLCIELLAPQPNEIILDACAAPGGKSLAIADAMQTGRVVALDLPSLDEGVDVRFERLKENLLRAPAGVQVALMPGDLLETGPRYLREHNLPETYDAVLLDAPCSNTGVMRHRIDVKWRLRPEDFAAHAAQQFALLRAAARLVRPGGRLVYSTCSIDPEENEEVVRRFLAANGKQWALERHVLAFPWVDGHDGTGVFLLRKS